MSAADWSAVLKEIDEITRDSLAGRPQSQELEFFDGRIGEHELGLRRLFLARSDEGRGRIEGYIVCNPIENGRKWSTEIYRHRSDSVRGVIAFLMHTLTCSSRTKVQSKLISVSCPPGTAKRLWKATIRLSVMR